MESLGAVHLSIFRVFFDHWMVLTQIFQFTETPSGMCVMPSMQYNLGEPFQLCIHH
jgi:hypothetical protein